MRTPLGEEGGPCTVFTRGPSGCFPAALAHSLPRAAGSSPHLVETQGLGFCIALFLVVEAVRDSGSWEGEARGSEEKEREESKGQGAWLVKSQCVRERQGGC